MDSHLGIQQGLSKLLATKEKPTLERINLSLIANLRQPYLILPLAMVELSERSERPAVTVNLIKILVIF